MLQIRNLESYYGGLQVLKRVSLHVEAGEIVALIGANGAGKSTLLNSIVGIVARRQGNIVLDAQEITHLAPRAIVRRGVSLVPEGRQLFAPLTVLDNLLLGAYQRFRRGAKGDIAASLERMFAIFPVLKQRQKQSAGTLSGGEQQMLAIARALMSQPSYLLLDEPSMGLAPRINKDIFSILAGLREAGTSIFLVEQNARMALEVADRGYVLETGRVVFEGLSRDLLQNNEVIRAYLGKGYEHVWD